MMPVATIRTLKLHLVALPPAVQDMALALARNPLLPVLTCLPGPVAVFFFLDDAILFSADDRFPLVGGEGGFLPIL